MEPGATSPWIFTASPIGAERACLDPRNVDGDPDMFHNRPPRIPARERLLLQHTPAGAFSRGGVSALAT